MFPGCDMTSSATDRASMQACAGGCLECAHAQRVRIRESGGVGWTPRSCGSSSISPAASRSSPAARAASGARSPRASSPRAPGWSSRAARPTLVRRDAEAPGVARRRGARRARRTWARSPALKPLVEKTPSSASGGSTSSSTTPPPRSPSRSAQFTPEAWDKVYSVDLRGPVFLVQEALPYLEKSPCASVINVISAGAFLPVDLHGDVLGRQGRADVLHALDGRPPSRRRASA